MKRVYYNKLIRDGIKTKIENKGEALEVRTLTDDSEFQQELLKKVKEEADALATSRSKEDFLSEYADLVIVLEELIEQLGLSTEEIEKTKAANIEKKGGFKDRLYLHWSEDTDYTSNETPQGIK